MIDDIDIIAANIKNGIEKTRDYTATPGEGVTRLPFTEEAKKCTEYLLHEMIDAGLETKVDNSGAVVGVLRGQSDERIMIGSHLDSVSYGGAYDGMAGILCGLEVAKYYKRNNLIPPYTLEIVGTHDEEGERFGGGYFSSKAFLGKWRVDDLKNTSDRNGVTYYEAIKQYGLNPEQIETARRDISGWKGFVEIHIEQGPVLEAAGVSLGIVNAIVAMERFYVTIKGRADHAGTEPMNMRLDSMMEGVKIMSRIDSYVRSHEGMVGTVGEVHLYPNAINVVPEKLVFSVDLRSIDEEELRECKQMVMDELQKIKEIGFEFEVVNTLSNSVTKMRADWMEKLVDIANDKGYSNMILHSGAGHDSAVIGKQVDTVMLFVPSIGGRSHNCDEKSDEKELAKAVITVADFINKM